MRTFPYWIAILAALIGGCASRVVYHIELKPDGHDIVRVLSVETQSGSDPPAVSQPEDDEVKRIAAFYKEPPVNNPQGWATFTASFRGDMPADVGGAGTYTHFDNSLGYVSIYNERFRGDDDLVGALLKRQAAIDELVDLLMQWIDFEIQDEADAKRVKMFLDVDLRKDLKNLCLYFWTAGRDVESENANMLYFRMARYLAERNYFTIEQVPKFVRRLAAKDEQQTVDLVRELVMRKIEHSDDQPAPKSLNAMSDLPRVEKSLRAFLRTTDEFQELVSQCEIDGTPITDDSPNPMQVLSDRIFASALPSFGNARERVDVRLHVPLKPHLTNGTWDAESKVAEWNEDIDRVSVPAFAYAVWSVPDSKVQTDHFGRVILEQEDLAHYILWHAGLTGDEAKQWNAMLDGLKSESNPTETLRSFKFDDSPELADWIVPTLIDELKKAAK